MALIGVTTTIVAATIIVPAGLALSATITVHEPDREGRVFVDVVGTIKDEDFKTFKEKTDQIYPIGAGYPRKQVIVTLVSYGGSINPALQIGDLIRKRSLSTFVPGDRTCTSACALIWLAGVPRTVGDTPQIGFHAIYDPTTRQPTGAGNAVAGAYLRDLGVGYKAIAFMTRKGPTSVEWLTPDLTKELGVAWAKLQPPRAIPIPSQLKLQPSLQAPAQIIAAWRSAPQQWAKRMRGRLTLAVLIQDWARLHLAHRRPRYAAEAVRALRHALAKYLERPAEDLDRAAVVHALDSLSRQLKDKGGRSKTAPLGTAIACRTAAYGRACFAWAMKRGTVTSNPFAELPMPSSITRRERVLTDEEAAAIWRAACEAPLPYGTIVRLLMLTGQRREEVAGMTWAELSEDLATWTIPATRTKNGTPHLVPLSQPASKILQALRSDGPGDVQGAHQRAKLALVFPGERGTPFSGWSKAKLALDTASGVSGWWLHDLRRTLATGLQRLGVRLEVTEGVLNHLSGSRAGVVGIYQRHDWAEEKRDALDAWSAHLLTAAEGRLPAGKVLPFSRAGSGEM